jgi:CheY-like chemotaxis protein
MTDAVSGHPTVLVVDDDADVRQTIIGLLEPRGFTVIDAPNGRQALEILQQDPTIDVLFTDVMMPGISGITLAKKALEARPALKVVLTSAYVGEAGPVPTLPLVRKPFVADDLVRAILATLDAGKGEAAGHEPEPDKG